MWVYAESTDFGALQKKLSEIHVEIIAKELNRSSYTAEQKMDIIGRIIRTAEEGGKSKAAIW